jgi:hypothetical protein
MNAAALICFSLKQRAESSIGIGQFVLIALPLLQIPTAFGGKV